MLEKDEKHVKKDGKKRKQIVHVKIMTKDT